MILPVMDDLFTIVKMMFHTADLLIILVSFSGDQHKIAGSGMGQRQRDRGGAIRLYQYGGNGP